MSLDINAVRAQFPSLKDGFIFGDSAGGSQCLGTVIEDVKDYLTNTNVQLGATYPIGETTTLRVQSGPISTAWLVNASSPDEIVFSNSSTQLAENLSRALEPNIAPHGENEFIVCYEHETNVGPWVRLAERTGNKVFFWKPSRLQSTQSNQYKSTRVNSYAVGLSIDDLVPLLTGKTRLVALSACSNILGTFNDIKEIIKTIRRVVEEKSSGKGKVEIVVDCVAYAPHRRVDVQDWDVDYAFFSYYKVYGPHTAAMYVRASSIKASLNSIAHYFITDTDKSTKLHLGGPGYELTYAVGSVLNYFAQLTNSEFNSKTARLTAFDESNRELVYSTLSSSFEAIKTQEEVLVAKLLSFLTAQEQWDRGYRVVGSEEVINRAPTISFVVIQGTNGQPAMRSQDVANPICKQGHIGIRFGHFYAARLIDWLGLPADDGVIRISLLHYNTEEEVDVIIAALKQVIN